MIIHLYSGFTKRINSTKLPTGTPLVLTGTLKEPCSIESPVIPFEFSGPTTPATYTYAYILEFNRYYFIDNWTWNNGLWEASFREDYLASWKTSIGNTNAYIDRCSNTFDGDIVDTTYPTTTNYNISKIALDIPWNLTGCFILGIIDSENSANSQLGGAVTYYVLTTAECKALMHYLLSTDFLDDIGFPSVQSITQQMSQEMAKAFINPLSYITSCMWFPLPATTFSDQVTASQISVGYWKISTNIVTGRLVNVWQTVTAYQGTLPDHPQAATRGAYLNYAPYTRINLFVPPFGIIPFDTSFRRRGNLVTAYIAVDPITGQGNLLVTCDQSSSVDNYDNSPIVTEATAMIGVPIQLAQINTDIFHAGVETIQAGISGASAIASAFTLNASGVASGISSTVSHIANAIDCMSPQVRTHGTDGSRIYCDISARIIMETIPLVDEDNAEIGRPLRKIRQISTIPGYIKCSEVTVDYACFATEKEAILNFLMSGFFYE